jgi:hypothetical protein
MPLLCLPLRDSTISATTRIRFHSPLQLSASMMQAESMSPSPGGEYLALLPEEILFQVSALLAACCAEAKPADPPSTAL